MSSEKSYQWIKGDYKDTIDIFDNNDGEWITFKSGHRISAAVFNEFLFEVGTKPPQATVFKGATTVAFEQDEDNYSKVMFEESKHIPQNVGVNQSTSNVHVPQPEPKPKASPIQLLLNQSTKETAKFALDIEVEVPKKSVYALIKDAFESANVDEEILNSIYAEINNKEFQDKIKKQIEEKIKLHYK